MKRGGDNLVCHAADRVWLERLGLSSVRRVMKVQPEIVAALSGSSETFPMKIPVEQAEPVEPVEPGAPKLIFVKRYHYRSRLLRLRGAFRGTLLGRSRARFEYEFLAEMRRRGVPAVRPIAYGQRRKYGFVRACVLITEGVEAVTSLARWISDHQDKTNGPAHRSGRIAEALGRALRRMHQAGVRHGGLYARNILVRQADGAGVDFLFLDPERSGGFRAGAVPQKDIVVDLAALAASVHGVATRSDMVRFMRAYLDTPGLNRTAIELIRAVAGAMRPHVRQEVHRLAVGASIDWLRQRVERRMSETGPAPRARIDSVESFFDRLAPSDMDMQQPGGAAPRDSDPATERHVPMGPAGGRPRSVHFAFREAPDAPVARRYTVTIDGGGIRARPGTVGRADLTVEADEAAWLAIVNGEPDAFGHLRQGRLALHGDTSLLSELTRILDA